MSDDKSKVCRTVCACERARVACCVFMSVRSSFRFYYYIFSFFYFYFLLIYFVPFVLFFSFHDRDIIIENKIARRGFNEERINYTKVVRD